MVPAVGGSQWTWWSGSLERCDADQKNTTSCLLPVVDDLRTLGELDPETVEVLPF